MLGLLTSLTAINTLILNELLSNSNDLPVFVLPLKIF